LDREQEKNLVDQIIAGEAEVREEIDPELLTDFLIETKEHLENIEMYLLTLETDGENMEIINGIFREFHTIKGLAGFVSQDLVRTIAHQTETLLDECRKGQIRINKRIIDLILTSADFIKKVCDNLDLTQNSDFHFIVEAHLETVRERKFDSTREPSPNIGEAKTSVPVDEKPVGEKIGEILVGKGQIDQAELNELLVKQTGEYPDLKLGQVAVKEKKATAKDVLESLRLQEKGKKLSVDSGYIRVPTLKIDNLVDMMGEMLITQSLIEQEAIERFGTNDMFISNLLRMGRIAKDLQNLSMSLRMVSLKSTFQKLNRVGRDSIEELQKNITLRFDGEETEIDRNVADKILDPLIHLLKNAISHGIETEQERIEKNKPPVGLVSVLAYSKRGNVYIEVADNGRGLPTEKIYQKAVDRGLLNPANNYTEDEITDCIFQPGFSTAEKVNNVSGRGVGLDVVKTEITRIGGRVEVNNHSGEGCTFILRIPINLAAINGTIVEIMGTHYIIPTINVKQILKPEPSQWVSVSGATKMIRIRDQVISVIPINEIFGMEDVKLEEFAQLVVVIELDQKLKALPVQGIEGRKEIVVKSLGEEFLELNFVSGASILGDGKVSLILDVENLFKMEGGDRWKTTAVSI
jgi:two-component system chemotaxis sensor kinase CheA